MADYLKLDISALFKAAIAGDADSTSKLDVLASKTDKDLRTILHSESLKGNLENVRFILSKFASKNLLLKLNHFNETALLLAASYGHTEVVQLLIDAARQLPSASSADNNPVTPLEAFVRRADNNSNTALHVAVRNGKVGYRDVVTLLVQADPSHRHIRNRDGKTPIYIAADRGLKDILELICTTCAPQSLDGPGGTTALHILIKEKKEAKEKHKAMMRIIINAAKRWSTTEEASASTLEALFNKTDESGRNVLDLAVERNNVDAAQLILLEDPAYARGSKKNGLMRIIFKLIDDDNKALIKVLSKTYEAGIDPHYKDVFALILAIKRHDEESVLSLLEDSKHLVTFTEDNGWTPFHYAAYHEFDSILDAIIKAQKDVGHPFVYENKVSTPFHVAAKYGYTSTLVELMQLWPVSSTEFVADSPYTALNEDGRNILHLAAIDNNKDMVQAIMKYCPEKYKDEILKQQDINMDTPLHILISQGCFIPELIKHKGRDAMAKNKNGFTPRDMLYVKDDIVADQVHIKIALDNILTNKSAWKLWAKNTEKKTDIWTGSKVAPSRRKKKDKKFDEGKKLLMDAKHVQMKKDLERYKMRTNTQIIVTALITTVTFTVGFTMPGGLRQSGEVNEGSVILSNKTAFNAFMVSDALALLLSTSSLFFYFLESMNENPKQVSILNAASTVLNIVSIVAMMLTFIFGTYVVLSHSQALAITVCIISSIFFLVLIIILLIKIVHDRQVKKNED